ncbi:MAG: hypothetical protein ACI8T1_005097 [Verrucomicrobiales bacterium]|jgi:hypothetical protein
MIRFSAEKETIFERANWLENKVREAKAKRCAAWSNFSREKVEMQRRLKA